MNTWNWQIIPWTVLMLVFGLIVGKTLEHERMEVKIQQMELNFNTEKQLADQLNDVNEKWQDTCHKADALVERCTVELVQCRTIR